MKRLCLILAYLFLFTQTASAMSLLIGQKVVYRGTVTGLRISAVDGTAFIDNVSITPELQNAKLLSSGSVTAENLKLSAADGVAFVDFSAADVLTNNIGKYIVIKDSTGREIKGWIKAAGSSETLGDELVDTWTNGGATNTYETLTLSGSDITQAVNSADSGIATKNMGTANGVLLRATITNYAKSSGNSPIFLVGCEQYGTVAGSSKNGTPVSGLDWYVTQNSAANSYVAFRNPSVTGDWSATGISVKQVLTPSATGVTIVSTKGGTTYNWESKDASFTYNSAITYSIYDRDLTAYADGNHQIEIYDSSNRMLKGVLKAAGTAETLDSDLLSGLNLASGWSANNVTITGANTFDVTVNYGLVFKNLMTLNGLYKGSFTATGLSGIKMADSSISKFVYSSGVTNIYRTFPASGNTNLYFTPTMSGIGSVTISSASIARVLTPSASGATITTLKNGDVYNWSYKNSSFSFNSASYYVIIKLIR